MDTLEAMRVFVAVAESGGFSEAARRLRRSKAVVSKQVAALEDRLGARLLNRTTRRCSLTEIGQVYFESCRSIIDSINEAEDLVTRHQDEPRGVLRISVPVSFAIRYLSAPLASFAAAHPELAVDVALDDRRVDLVDGGFDLAIRVGVLPDSSLVARRLAMSRMFACASPAYLAARGRPQTPEDLVQHDCLRYAYFASGDEWVFNDAEGRERRVRTRGPIRSNNGDVLTQLAVAGHGVILHPDFICGADIAAGRLIPVLEEFTATEFPVNAVYPHARHLSAKVRRFVDHLVAAFYPKPPWAQP